MGLFSLLSQRVGDTVNALGASIAGYFAIGLLALLGAGFLLAAGFMGLADAIGPIAAACAFGAAFVLVAAIWWGVLAMRAQERKRRQRDAAASTAAMASSLTLANTGLRLAGRIRGRGWIAPLAAAALAAWFFTRESDD